MKKLLVGLVAALLIAGVAGTVLAATDTATQGVTVTVAEIAVVNATGGALALAIVAPTQGGALPADVTDSTAYLQYSSNGTDALTSRKITVAINAATPATYNLKLLAGAPTGTNTGTAVAQTTLGTTAVDLITGIKDGNTGVGATDGSNLTYTLTCVSMPAVDTVGITYTVTFTLTAAA